MDIALDPAATLLLQRLKSLYYCLQQRPHRGNALDDPNRSRDHSINTSLGGASSRFGDNWHALLPWERERAVDRLLAAYCVTRTPHDDFVWTKLNYRPLRQAVGFKDIPEESSLTLMDTRSAPYFQVSDLVRSIRNLCIESRRTDALSSCTSWEEAFLSRSGITRGKLYRLELGVQKEVVFQVRAVFAEVSERLPTGRTISSVLPSADAILSSAHNAFQHASTRFATFVGFVDSLIVLYASSPSRGADVALLRDVRQSFEKRMTVVEVPSVVELRTAEVHFTMLTIDQQVQAVSNGRALLFHACSEVHALQPLPDAHQIRSELLNALAHPQLMRAVRRAQAAGSTAPH